MLHIVLLLVMCVLSSCDMDLNMPSGICDSELYEITVEMDAPEGQDLVRSSFTYDDLTKITDVNIFIYHKGKLLDEYSRYVADASSLMIAFPYNKDVFNVYVLCNVGEINAPSDESMIENLRYVVKDYERFREKGFPAFNVFRNYRKGTLARFGVKRIVGQYNIAVKSSAKDAVYVIKDVRLMNCVLDVFPFSPGTKATVFTRGGAFGEMPCGDVLTDEDLVRLNDGHMVPLYFIENVQGELLPGNTDRRKKIPSSLNGIEEGLAECCTYIELTVDITTPAARYTGAKYRFYLGQNEFTDFSIVRNTVYNVTLDFTQNMVSEQEWRIEAGEPQVDALILSKGELNVVKGIADHILIDGPEVRINVDESDSEVCCFRLTDVVSGGVCYQKLTCTTDEDIVGMYAWKDEYQSLAKRFDLVLESVETYNEKPLVRRVIPVYVYNKIFPLFVRISDIGTASPYRLEVLTNAPVGCDLEVAASVEVETVTSGVSSFESYVATPSFIGTSSEGISCCYADFPGLFDVVGDSDGKVLYFRKMSLDIHGSESECSTATEMYMGDGGNAYWGPGPSMYPQRYPDVSSNADVSTTFAHVCTKAGCVKYQIVSGSTIIFNMAPKFVTCSQTYSTGMSNTLVWNINEYNSGKYMPFYIANGGLEYSYPVTLQDDSPKYLDDSARKSIIYELYGPGRDVFYPNGAAWGVDKCGAPSLKHRFGCTIGLTRQFFGNVHNWQIYQGYECDFYMTVNGCTSWPGASGLSTGFRLTYNL